MQCPNCGAEIPNDKLICEACGAELEIISDFELDVESEMRDTLNNIAKEEFGDEFEDDDDLDFIDDPNLLSMILSGQAGGKLFYVILALLVVVVIFFGVKFGKKISSQNTLDFQLESANAAIEEEDFLTAIECYEKAYKIDSNLEYLFTIANLYYTLGRENDSLMMLKEIASTEGADVNSVREAYQKVISLYEASESYEEIALFLEDCRDETVKDWYKKYMVEEPVFSYESGTYEETLVLKLTTDLPGKIYYSMDASAPTTSSPVYDTPIFLEYGSYSVSAVYVNDFGVSSEVVKNKYLIDVDFVFEPVILTPSGEYNTATLIEAEVPVQYTLYYTTDGSEPDKSSTRYSNPIPMPLGDSTFKFVEYASDGTKSSVIEKAYCLEYDTAITPENALPYLKMKLAERGVLSDAAGYKQGVSGQFVYAFTTAYNFGAKGDFFLIVEYISDDFGNLSKTGDIYAMHVVNADLIYKVKISGSNYTLIDF